MKINQLPAKHVLLDSQTSLSSAHIQALSPSPTRIDAPTGSMDRLGHGDVVTLFCANLVTRHRFSGRCGHDLTADV